MSEIFGKKNYKESLKGLCCVEVSGESCANCLTLMPILKSIADARGDIRLVHVEADYDTTALMEEWDVCHRPFDGRRKDLCPLFGLSARGDPRNLDRRKDPRI